MLKDQWLEKEEDDWNSKEDVASKKRDERQLDDQTNIDDAKYLRFGFGSAPFTILNEFSKTICNHACRRTGRFFDSRRIYCALKCPNSESPVKPTSGAQEESPVKPPAKPQGEKPAKPQGEPSQKPSKVPQENPPAEAPVVSQGEPPVKLQGEPPIKPPKVSQENPPAEPPVKPQEKPPPAETPQEPSSGEKNNRLKK